MSVSLFPIEIELNCDLDLSFRYEENKICYLLHRGRSCSKCSKRVPFVSCFLSSMSP